MSQGTGVWPHGGPPLGNGPEWLLTGTATRAPRNHHAEPEGPDTRAQAGRDSAAGKKGLRPAVHTEDGLRSSPARLHLAAA